MKERMTKTKRSVEDALTIAVDKQTEATLPGATTDGNPEGRFGQSQVGEFMSLVRKQMMNDTR